MGKTRNKPNQQIRDEAAEWFVDFREGELDAEATRAFGRWLRTSPDHIKAYMEVAAFWADVPSVASKEEIDVQALIAYARAEDNVRPLGGGDRVTPSERGRAGKASRARFFSAKWALAASLLVLGVGAVLFALSRTSTYSTDIGEQRSILLGDGSTMELNARSRVRVSFNKLGRRIDLLEGQALFKVAKDPARPFVVRSGAMSVRAVGTQFDIHQKKSGVTVTVLEGRVAVGSAASQADPVLLSAGEQIVLNEKTPALPKPADVPAATAWTQRKIVFAHTPLGEVVEEFNRYNPRQLRVSDASLQDLRVSGMFSSTDPASLLRFLREQLRLQVVEDDRAIQISR